MTKEEYKLALNKLKIDFDIATRKIKHTYAFSNSSICVGDKITNHLGTILVDTIQFAHAMYKDFPECVYSGIKLNKDGTPNKKKERLTIYQSDVK